MKNIPISAMIGLFFTGLYFLMAIFAIALRRAIDIVTPVGL